MSDPKRATFITVGAPKSAKNNVNKTVRLTINLEESNESKYPELNYKELLRTAARKKRVENGKTTGLDPFSDNDDDVERVAKKFEQKYGGKSTYGRKGRSKYDEFADIGAGYDENDSFIDNTHGYDEMIPPECDTLYGGFYINSGSLEFKTVPENQSAVNDGDPNKRNKRRISSSSSEEESSDSSSESDSQEAKDSKAIANGEMDSHKTEHRKKKNKNIDKQQAKKVRRTDSSAATSGKQTSDDNVHGDGESADSRTSQSDSLTSKPAPSSENAVSSDSSRDLESKVEIKLPQAVGQVLEELESLILQLRDNPKDNTKTDQCVVRLDSALSKTSADNQIRRVAWSRAAKLLNVSRAKLLQRAKALKSDAADKGMLPAPPATSHAAHQTTANTITTANNSIANSTTATATASATTVTSSKRKAEAPLETLNISQLTTEEKEAKIVETLQRLKLLIEERKPGMMATYNAECERVQEERKKIQIASAAEGAPHIDKRLPKRRFPWCPRSRALLTRLATLAGDPEAAASLLATRALKLFPTGFVRMPTLLRQADLNKDIKASDIKRQRLGSTSSVITNTQQFSEPILFPSSLTVTTSVKNVEREEEKDHKYKFNAALGSIMNSYTLNQDLVIEAQDDRKKETERGKDEMYIPANNFGSITIIPVSSQKEKKSSNNNEKAKEPLLRVKSPAALNEMVISNKKDKDKHRKPDKVNKRVESPLHIDTNHQIHKKDAAASPKSKEEFSQKQIESMRIAESNIPRPGLVPLLHSPPTFAKPDKRPPEVKKKKDILIISDMDPLADIQQEPLAVDDSSSDVEVVEERLDKGEPKSENKSDTVPLKDKVSEIHKKVNVVKHRSEKISSKELRKESEDTTKEDIDFITRNIREMKHSQDPTKLNCNSYGGVITSAKLESSKQTYNRPAIFGEARSDKDKFTERTSLSKMDGCNAVTG